MLHTTPPWFHNVIVTTKKNLVVSVLLLLLVVSDIFPSSSIVTVDSLSIRAPPRTISLQTRTTLSNNNNNNNNNNKDVASVQSFLATPTNWPKIVASSVAVQAPSSIKKKPNLSQPFQVGDQVEEIFGLPPVLPLSVEWKCTQNKPGQLTFISPQGLSGVATNCQMLFAIDKDDSLSSDVVVNLTMQYEPVSPLAVLAIPILTLDNAFALKVLLPFMLRRA